MATTPTIDRHLDITATDARVGDVWLGNGDILISAVTEGPVTEYIPAGSTESVTGPLVRIKGRIISGRDRGFDGYWSVQPGQPMEVRRS